MSNVEPIVSGQITEDFVELDNGGVTESPPTAEEIRLQTLLEQREQLQVQINNLQKQVYSNVVDVTELSNEQFNAVLKNYASTVNATLNQLAQILQLYMLAVQRYATDEAEETAIDES